MKITGAAPVILAVACLVSAGCDKKVGGKEPPPFRIIAKDAGFVAPVAIVAGIRHIIFENQGSEIHEAMLVKLAADMSADDYVAAVKRGELFPKGALDYSGPGLTSPGKAAEMWLKVDPGQYVLICWNSDHDRTQPVHPFTVGETVLDNEVPKEDVVVKLVDFKFEIKGNFRAGKQVIRIETPGPTMHEIDFFRLHEGKTVDDLRRWRKDDGRGPAPADALGGALDSHDLKHVVWLRKNFSPGRYVLHCEMPVETGASASGKNLTHADLGMVREFVIEK
jgi:hypothetical protein